MTVRLLPFEIGDGPTNMAADETLVETAAGAGVASLRFYGWSPPTLSLGYFQPAAARFSNARLATLPWVRRPSGGATLVHDNELTYALALPPGPPWQTGTPWMAQMHRVIATALGELGLQAITVEQPLRLGEVLCFQQQTPGDLLAAGAKVVGSAQRKLRRALLQHGSVLLERSLHAPELAGLVELTGARVTAPQLAEKLATAFERYTGFRLQKGAWTDEEMTRRDALAAAKYVSPAWNERR